MGMKNPQVAADGGRGRVEGMSIDTHRRRR